MICPYIFTVKQSNKNKYEYDEAGNNVALNHTLVEVHEHMTCKEEGCTAYMDGKCQYKA